MDENIHTIEATGASLTEKLREVWQSRELIRILAVRDLRVRYAQTVIGVLWAVLNPVVNLLILFFVFHRVSEVGTSGIPPLLYTAVGLLGWTYFAECVGQGGDSFLSNQALVKKVYFPRLVLPLSKALLGLVEFGINLLLIVCLMWVYNQTPGPYWWSLFIFVGLNILFGLASSVWVSALTVRYRDFRFIIPTVLRIGMFVSPVAYSANEVSETWRWLYFMNPAAGIIEGVKWSILGTNAPSLHALNGLIVLIIGLISGSYYFNKVEEVVADWI